MPQMAPLLWLNLYIIFTLCFLFFNILNYYSFKYTNKSKNSENVFSKNILNLMWKW